jgi:gliding motility-associated-like protein
MANSNSSNPVVSPTATTMYYVDMDDNGCLNRDSVKVRVTDKVFLQAMNDTTICQGDPIQLKVNSDAFVYSWSNASQLNNASFANPMAITNNTTTYEVTASIGSCTAKEQVVVTAVPYPKVQAGIDTTICFKGIAQLEGSTDGSLVSWSPASSLYASNSLNTVARPLQTTSYILSASDTKGCPKSSKDTVVVVVLPDIQPFAGRDTSVIIRQNLQLNATGGFDYQWSPAIGLSATNVANPIGLYTAPSEGIRYKVLVYNEAGCADSSYVTVKVFATGPTVFVPNAFTPNGDGKNEKIRPVAVGMQRVEYFKIFNRWGELVHSSQPNDMGWDGTIGGKPQGSETYIWTVKAIDFNGKAYFQKGTLTLIR